MGKIEPINLRSEGGDGAYRAYLVRCWQEREATGWRFSLEEVGPDSQRRGFTELDELVNFLRGCLKAAATKSW